MLVIPLPKNWKVLVEKWDIQSYLPRTDVRVMKRDQICISEQGWI